MYAWIWQRLPGNAAVRAGLSLLLFLAAVAILFKWVFPWAEPLLPFGDVTVNDGGTSSVQPTGAPTGTASPSPSGGGKSSAPTIDGAALPTYIPRVPLVPTGVVA
ncbi:hypothetical protein ACEZCY_13770 [Streptacidiphilus sp. N1-12]|uniref:Uncharacterized protein n=2 Tax=Streptacidiphilus alkalitolerans TaxID=3342712 RepID=A0ABV6WE35_9ACTN